MIRGKLNPVDQMVLDFNGFLRKMVPLKKNVPKSLLRNCFPRLSGEYIRLGCAVHLPKIAVEMRYFGAFKTRIRPFYEEVYGTNRVFDVINDEVFGHIR